MTGVAASCGWRGSPAVARQHPGFCLPASELWMLCAVAAWEPASCCRGLCGGMLLVGVRGGCPLSPTCLSVYGPRRALGASLGAALAASLRFSVRASGVWRRPCALTGVRFVGSSRVSSLGCALPSLGPAAWGKCTRSASLSLPFPRPFRFRLAFSPRYLNIWSGRFFPAWMGRWICF